MSSQAHLTLARCLLGGRGADHISEFGGLDLLEACEYDAPHLLFTCGQPGKTPLEHGGAFVTTSAS